LVSLDIKVKGWSWRIWSH